MKDLKIYHLKLTIISPLHIGTGESFEPTNFVIDNEKLYEFDEILFYKSLSPLDKKTLDNKMSNWLQIIEFYKTKKEQAKQLAYFECSVSKEVQKKYDAKNPNQLIINKTFKNPNTHRAIITGSSIKGMLDTVLKIYAKPEVASNEERQQLIISDALLVNGDVEIGFSYRKHRVKNNGNKIPQMLEVIKPHSTFVLTIKTKYSFEEIQKFMKKYHDNRANSIYKEDEKSFIARIGKYVGMEYMVDNGKNLRNRFGKPLATYSIYNSDKLKDVMFGWVKLELIDEDSYKNCLSKIKTQEQEYYKTKEKRQENIIKGIKLLEQKARQKALEKQRELEEEKRKALEKKAKEEAKLASMSPLERKIEEFIQENPNMPKNTVLFNSIKDRKLDEYKFEALKLLKELMIKQKEWKETTKAKKPEKDKNFKRTQEVIKMLKEVK